MIFLTHALHDGSIWFMLGCFVFLAGVVIAISDRGSGIAHHPYTRPGLGGELAADLPDESIGRPEFEPTLRPRRRS